MARKDRTEYLKSWYIENKERLKPMRAAWAKSSRGKHSLQTRYVRHRKRNKDFARAYLKSHPCVDCGEPDLRCLEFDHVNGVKGNTISYLLRQRAGLKTLEKEIAKCEVRCANCHKKRHYVNTWRN